MSQWGVSRIRFCKGGDKVNCDIICATENRQTVSENARTGTTHLLCCSWWKSSRRGSLDIWIGLSSKVFLGKLARTNKDSTTHQIWHLWIISIWSREFWGTCCWLRSNSLMPGIRDEHEASVESVETLLESTYRHMNSFNLLLILRVNSLMQDMVHTLFTNFTADVFRIFSAFAFSTSIRISSRKLSIFATRFSADKTQCCWMIASTLLSSSAIGCNITPDSALAIISSYAVSKLQSRSSAMRWIATHGIK